jgi:hypothetical protein
MTPQSGGVSRSARKRGRKAGGALDVKVNTWSAHGPSVMYPWLRETWRTKDDEDEDFG